MVTNLSRVMFAIGRLKVAAVALTGSWLLVIAADVVLAELAPPDLVVGALALGTTIGQTLVAIPLAMTTRRICGKAAMQGVGRATLAGLTAGVAGAAVGVAVSLAVPVSHKLLAAGGAVVTAGCAVVAFGVVVYFLDNGDVKPVMARLRRLGRQSAA